jgi:hypothetical protein
MDFISYCSDIVALRILILSNPDPIFAIDKEGTIKIKTVQTPVKVNDNESLSIVSGFTQEQLESHGLFCLGTVDENGDYNFFSDEDKATYERVRNQKKFSDEDGNEFTESYKIGVIAS